MDAAQRKLAGYSVLDFQKTLAERDIYLNYDDEDLSDDLAASLRVP